MYLRREDSDAVAPETDKILLGRDQGSRNAVIFRSEWETEHHVPHVED